MEPALLSECANWIAEMMNEEGFFIDADLVEDMLKTEQRLGITIPLTPHAEAAARISAALYEDGIRAAPGAVDVRLVQQVLEWEDEFLSFAGRARN